MDKADIWLTYDSGIQPKERIASEGDGIGTRISNEVGLKKIRSCVK